MNVIMLPLCIYLILSLQGTLSKSNTNYPCYVSKTQVILSQAWWFLLETPALEERRQEDREFKAGLGHAPELLPVMGSFCLYGSINPAL